MGAVAAGQALPYWQISFEVAVHAGVRRKAAAASGRTLSVSDSLLAALAKEHDATLLTSNIKDYAGNDTPCGSTRGRPHARTWGPAGRENGREKLARVAREELSPAGQAQVRARVLMMEATEAQIEILHRQLLARPAHEGPEVAGRPGVGHGIPKLRPAAK